MTKRHSKASIMLLEIMINIAFFAIMIAICMQLLIKALNTSTKTTELNQAVTVAESVAELYKASNGNAEYVLLTYVVPEGYGYEIEASDNNTANGVLHKAHIEVNNSGGSLIYELDTSVYETGGGSHE